MTESIECVCTKCGEPFDEDLLVKIPYTEYAGASMQTQFASPCCHAEWDYIEEE